MAALVPAAGEHSENLSTSVLWVPPALRTSVRCQEDIMKLPRRNFLQVAAGAAAFSGVSRVAWAQTYPTRPITIIAPFGAGGATDVIGRVVAERMRASLGQIVIIENVTGATGSLGVGRLARAAPDGYTLDIGQWATHVTNGAIYALPYDLLRDFEPIALLASQPYLIVGKKALSVSDLTGLIAWLKANPDKASQGTSGVGGGPHITGVFFQNATGTRFQFVPYRGGTAPAMQDLVAGQIDLMFDSPITALPQVRAGAIKAYAVTAKSRLAGAPDIPTTEEAGLPGFHAANWYALFARAGTPKEVIARLNAAVVDALANPVVRQRFADMGTEIPPREQQTPEALGAFQKAEIEKWWPIIKAANIRGE
jgi:tripartite-type tricarboxylate transporter receptor subunit TctC